MYNFDTTDTWILRITFATQGLSTLRDSKTIICLFFFPRDLLLANSSNRWGNIDSEYQRANSVPPIWTAIFAKNPTNLTQSCVLVWRRTSPETHHLLQKDAQEYF